MCLAESGDLRIVNVDPDAEVSALIILCYETSKKCHLTLVYETSAHTHCSVCSGLYYVFFSRDFPIKKQNCINPIHSYLLQYSLRITY